MEYALTISNDTGELILDGDITVESAHALHGALLNPQGAVRDLVVNMSDVREIDVTCLQLLCSAHQAAMKDGRQLKLTNVSPATGDAMETLGFVRHVGCREDTSGSCLWRMGKTG
jgi:anti-anti-sigma factor